MNQHKAKRLWRLIIFLVLITASSGCQSSPQLMPTPNLYAWGDFDPYADVPPQLQNNCVEVLYMTDRSPQGDSQHTMAYGFGRSRAVAVGVSVVQFGNDVSWPELVQASRSLKRSVKLDVTVPKTTEIVRFPVTPRKLVQVENPTTSPTSAPARVMLGDEKDAEELAAEDAVRRGLSARMALTPVKEVYLFVHGYNNDFQESVQTIAQLWHFLGRQGVPIAYSWPAGSKGLLRGYTYDRESSEFTVFHLKQMLRIIASCPDVRKINIICHSRGTDVVINSLRELHLEITGSGRSTREVLKLGTLVMAAPDVDLDVVIQKFSTVRLGQVPERFVVYVCSQDKALGLANWLFGGGGRFGQLKANLFTPAELETMRNSSTIQIVDAQISNPGSFGHDYFHSNPAVSSDLILLLRYHRSPGADTGRPLRITPHGFWAIDDSYPRPSDTAPVQIAGK
jgi:esterase/lipase superfamily enzyme